MISGLTKSVMTKDDTSSQGKDIKINACEDSYIYIDSTVNSVSIINCVNSTIYISAVTKICTVEKCENISLTVASNLLRVGNTVDSCIFYYGTYYPVLYGDNRSITLAPNNANHNEIPERLKKAKIQLTLKHAQNF